MAIANASSSPYNKTSHHGTISIMLPFLEVECSLISFVHLVDVFSPYVACTKQLESYYDHRLNHIKVTPVLSITTPTCSSQHQFVT